MSLKASPCATGCRSSPRSILHYSRSPRRQREFLSADRWPPRCADFSVLSQRLSFPTGCCVSTSRPALGRRPRQFERPLVLWHGRGWSFLRLPSSPRGCNSTSWRNHFSERAGVRRAATTRLMSGRSSRHWDLAPMRQSSLMQRAGCSPAPWGISSSGCP